MSGARYRGAMLSVSEKATSSWVGSRGDELTRTSVMHLRTLHYVQQYNLLAYHCMLTRLFSRCGR
jgi:hypothetical protein